MSSTSLLSQLSRIASFVKATSSTNFSWFYFNVKKCARVEAQQVSVTCENFPKFEKVRLNQKN